ncbi:unnamed protein product [Dovyalis caffra]|uniref:Phytocyanin domain-containing protein n=1 Tax=Dovyalis caffra TaxID=77055 RepID=A0AAV1SL16_9ROSI|nr:unnamed protein product [Dovyalis caffra]
MGQIDYQEWAANKNFHVGYTLVFNYNDQFHNVKQVTHQGYESCNATSPAATYTNGSDTVTLEKLGHFYFICGYPGHCLSGQKIDILVASAASNLSPAPSPKSSERSSASHLYLISMAAVYQVGESAGWTSMGQIDYQEWAANKNFHVGDTLVFNYNNQFHNLKQVTHERYESCNATSPIATYSNGSDTVALEKLGHLCFVCGYPGHCLAGQKIDVLVAPAASNLSPAPPPQSSEPSSASYLYLTNLSWTLSVLLAFCLSGFAY